MRKIILFIILCIAPLLWVAPIPFWIKYIFTVIWVIQIVSIDSIDDKITI